MAAEPEPGPAAPVRAQRAAPDDDGVEVELMNRVASGERGAAMRQLVDIYSGRLYGLGRRLLGDPGMAEELVQDTMLRLWRSADRFDPARGSVRTFVFTLARRAAIDLRRRAAARPLELAADPAADLPDDELRADEYSLLVERLEVRDAMLRLSEDHRRALSLSFDEDLTQAQIAARLGIPLGTVKSRLHHALRALRAELERRGVVEPA